MAVTHSDCPLIYYNGVYIREITKFIPESNPVYDEMDNLMYVEHTITVEAFISGEKDLEDYCDAGIAGAMEESIPTYGYNQGNDFLNKTDRFSHLAKLRLLEPRRELRIVGSGWGNTIILGGTATRHGGLGADVNSAIVTDGEMQDKQRLGADSDFELASGEREYYSTASYGPDSNSQSLNAGRNHVDVNFGPKPTLYTMTPIGGRNSARVEWEVKFWTRECLGLGEIAGSNRPGALGDILSFLYSIEYSLDEMFLSTRSIKGKVKIAANQGNNTIGYPENVDSIRDTILLRFTSPDWFKRTKQNFKLNENRSELSFEIEDTEVESEEALPAGAIDIQVEHNLQSNDLSFVKWDNELSGEISLAPNVPYIRVLAIMQEIIRARVRDYYTIKDIDFSEENHDPALNNGNFKAANTPKSSDKKLVKYQAWPISFKMRESLFGRRKKFAFTFGWHYILNDPSELWVATGFGGGIANQVGYTWPEWKGSIQMEYDPRGYARLTDEDGKNRMLVDLCDSVRSDENLAAVRQEANFVPTIDVKEEPVSRRTNPFFFINIFDQKPPEQSSFNPPINQKIETEVQKGYQKGKGFGGGGGGQFEYNKTGGDRLTSYSSEGQSLPADTAVYGSDPGEAPAYAGTGSTEFINQKAGNGTGITISQSAPFIRLIVRGVSERYWGPMPAPKIEKFGGADVEIDGEKYITERIENDSGATVYKNIWEQSYVVKGEISNDLYETRNNVTMYPTGMMNNSSLVYSNR
jgi:hypothetical protein